MCMHWAVCVSASEWIVFCRLSRVRWVTHVLSSWVSIRCEAARLYEAVAWTASCELQLRVVSCELGCEFTLSQSEFSSQLPAWIQCTLSLHIEQTCKASSSSSSSSSSSYSYAVTHFVICRPNRHRHSATSITRYKDTYITPHGSQVSLALSPHINFRFEGSSDTCFVLSLYFSLSLSLYDC